VLPSRKFSLSRLLTFMKKIMFSTFATNNFNLSFLFFNNVFNNNESQFGTQYIKQYVETVVSPSQSGLSDQFSDRVTGSPMSSTPRKT